MRFQTAPRVDGHGVLYKAKRRHSREPDLRGSIRIGDQEYWLSGWTRVGQLGRDPVAGEYLSLSLRRREP
jgi:hypothetical protein